MRVNVQLINADTDEHLWAEDYDRDLTDVFAIQTDLAQQIVRELQAKLSPMEKAQIERRPTENSDAYLAFVEAHELFYRPDGTFRANTEKAEQLFERATTLDPNFAGAFAGLARVHDWAYHDFDKTPARKEKARVAAETAIRLQPDLVRSQRWQRERRVDAHWARLMRPWRSPVESPGIADPDRDLSFVVASDRHRFAAKVRAGRAILGWSQTELGRRAGLSQRSIYRLEMAAVDIRRSTVVALETVFARAGIDFEPAADGGFKVVVAPRAPQPQ